ncbi:MAG: hypothetical protein OXB88_05770 [Bacteriovoracales bacterium]|nr:hypothetical protein [Bacteriovoracales bacterium]
MVDSLGIRQRFVFFFIPYSLFWVFTISSLVGLSGCASTKHETLQTYRKHLKEKRWDKALELARGSTFYKGEESKLLKWLEKGMLHHLKGEYFESQKYFDRAKKRSDQLFTVALSKKLLKSVGNDSLDHFYGEIYERSMLRFYSALNHYLLYQRGVRHIPASGKTSASKKKLSKRERRRHLEAARAHVVEWNAKIGEWRDERAGKTVFKDDLMAKVFGAFIHEQIGSRGEGQIAKLLYKGAQKTLFQNYNVYPSFNAHFKKFKKDFDKLPKFKKGRVEKNYLSSTKGYKFLKTYLEKKAKGKKANVAVLIHHGLIPGKRPKKHYYPLDFAVYLEKEVTGKMGIVDFTIQVLGLATVGGIPSIQFELPEIPSKPIKNRFYVKISPQAGAAKTKSIPLINPLNDIAKEAMEEHAAIIRLRLGFRLAAKHLLAIASSYRAYRAALKKGIPSIGAKIMATGLYAASVRAIALSEKADLRSWLSLPQGLNMASFFLRPGTYKLELLKENEGKRESVSISKIEVEKGRAKLLNFQVL